MPANAKKRILQEWTMSNVWYNTAMTIKHTVTFFILLSFFLAPFAEVQAGLLTGTKNEKKAEKKEKSEKWLLTYYVGYQNNYLKPKDVDYSLMTHIVVGGVGVLGDGSLNEHWHVVNGSGREMALDVGNRAEKAGVKKLIWLGGPNEEDKFYEATLDKNREKLVKNILKLLKELDYDGVDIDWEPVRKKDEPGLLALVKDLRKADPDIIITVPVNWVPSSILFTKDLSVYKRIAPYVDKMFIMSYSMAGPWLGWQSWHGGALSGDSLTTPSSLKSSTYAYRRAGVSKEQLGIGIGTYATCWEYPVKNRKQDLPSTFYSSAMHVMSMRTFMDEYYLKKYDKWDNIAKVPYQSYKKLEGDFKCGYISHENERSVKEKVEYVNKSGLAGVMVWNIGTGYFPDNIISERHSLLKKAWETLE